MLKWTFLRIGLFRRVGLLDTWSPVIWTNRRWSTPYTISTQLPICHAGSSTIGTQIYLQLKTLNFEWSNIELSRPPNQTLQWSFVEHLHHFPLWFLGSASATCYIPTLKNVHLMDWDLIPCIVGPRDMSCLKLSPSSAGRTRLDNFPNRKAFCAARFAADVFIFYARYLSVASAA